MFDLQNFIRYKSFDEETKFKLFEIFRLENKEQIFEELINFIECNCCNDDCNDIYDDIISFENRIGELEKEISLFKEKINLKS
jgi:hypothetical protein